MSEPGPQGRLIVVANRLPVTVKRTEAGWQMQPSVGGLSSALAALSAYTEMVWIGWPGLTAEPSQQPELEAQLIREHGCWPVFVAPGLFDRYYHGFSNNCLWPLFHYFVRLARYEAADWDAYRAVNALFAEHVLRVAQPGDCIWVHDYHLFLLPALLRERLPEAAVGFFLHIPFPSYELFRELPWREAVLRGLLGADLIGFHTYDYTRHFLRSLLRGLGLENDFGRLNVGGRVVRADTFPLSVDLTALADAAAQAAPLADGPGPRPRHILSVDRLDFTKGIPERLKAFALFLERYRDWRGQVRLTLICVPSRERVPAYQSLKRQIDELVGQINGRFSTPEWIPIHYLYQGFSPDELIAFYRTADVALVTPLRDGMNLVAKEYLACRVDHQGVLILSETAGAAAELGEALLVNPNDLPGIADALHRALTMPADEQARRNAAMRDRLRRYDVRRWGDDFLERLAEVKTAQSNQGQRRLAGAVRAELLAAYHAAERRLLLLDYDGTLVPLAALPEQAAPDDGARELLAALARDPRNTVVVISGRDNQTLQAWLGGLGAALVAEHGAWHLAPADGSWQLLGGDQTSDWKEQIRPLLQVYVDRTPGAVLEEKALALAWHYRQADPELGSQRAKELADNLASLVANTQLQVLRGSKVLEVKQSSVSKGAAALRWLAGPPAPDFVLAMGDDETDELMFTALPANTWTVRVGAVLHSQARFYVDGPEQARELLRACLGGRAADGAA